MIKKTPLLLLLLLLLLAVTSPTVANIQTDTIGAGQIAANAITASEIAAGSVTASKINVSSLSAITANLGTVTAGLLDGVEVRAGSSDQVVLNSSGITIEAGNSAPNQIKFDDGSTIFSLSDSINLWSDTAVLIRGGGASPTVRFGSSDIRTLNNAELDLGNSSQRFRSLFLADDLNWNAPPTTTSDDYPMVYSTGNTKLYRKTNGFSGTCSNPTSIVIERGIVVSCS